MNTEDVPLTPWSVQDNILLDANGNRLGKISGDWTSAAEDEELARYIADAVNWKVREDAP